MTRYDQVRHRAVPLGMVAAAAAAISVLAPAPVVALEGPASTAVVHAGAEVATGHTSCRGSVLVVPRTAATAVNR